jgi:membrane protein DedA with SNARE-associated domain
VLEQIVGTLSQLDIGYIYLVVLLAAFAENLVPPLPSDVIIVFAASLVGIKGGSGPLAVASAAIGSTLGFMAMFWIGAQVGHRVLETGRIKFISVDLVRRVENWFRHYGYWVIVGNRFLSGTRAVISFCAGASDLKLLPTTVLSFLSSAVYYGIVVYLSLTVGERWREIGSIMETYGTVVSVVIAALALGWGVVVLIRRRRTARAASKS